MQSQLPIGIQYVQALGPTVVALVIGIVAASLTWGQWKATRDKLRLDLFEKRYVIYDETQKVLATTLLNGTVTYDEITAYHRKTKGTEFLFEFEVEAYLDELRKHLNQLAYLERSIASNGDTNRSKHIEEARQIKDLLEKAVMGGVRSKFMKYLHFGHLA